MSHRKVNPEKSTEERPWHDHTEQEMLKQGQVVPVEIELWPTSMKWHKGQKLRFTISGFDYCPFPRGIVRSALPITTASISSTWAERMTPTCRYRLRIDGGTGE